MDAFLFHAISKTFYPHSSLHGVHEDMAFPHSEGSSFSLIPFPGTSEQARPSSTHRSAISGYPPKICAGPGKVQGHLETDRSAEWHSSRGFTPRGRAEANKAATGSQEEPVAQKSPDKENGILGWQRSNSCSKPQASVGRFADENGVAAENGYTTLSEIDPRTTEPRSTRRTAVPSVGARTTARLRGGPRDKQRCPGRSPPSSRQGGIGRRDDHRVQKRS